MERILNDVHRSFPGEAAVQRVVLYIDDLDRCPPARVVEVLEAVHLLLAFPLFVVVVGVDIRWVSQALLQRYPQQLAETIGIASPIDYLEKVFQIPFWLPPMDAAGGGRLLASAIGLPDPPVQASVQRTLTSHSSENGFHEDRPEVVVAQHVAATADEREPVIASGTASMIAAVPPPLQVPAEALRISDGERRRLVALAASAGISPRRSKRFANLYRLVKASLSPAERRSFVVENGRGGSFDTVMALLAATTGAPAAAGHLLAGLMDLPESYVDGSDQFARLLDSITPAPDERVAWASVRGALTSEPDTPRDLEDLRYWAPRVQRFCFGAVTGAAPARPNAATPMAGAPSD